jgi:hypothetical protein
MSVEENGKVAHTLWEIIGYLCISCLLIVSGTKSIIKNWLLTLMLHFVLVCVSSTCVLYSLNQTTAARRDADAWFQCSLDMSRSTPVFAYDIALAFGAMLGLFASGCLPLNTQLINVKEILYNFAATRSCTDEWTYAARSDAMCILLLWILGVIEPVRCYVMEHEHVPPTSLIVFGVISFAVSSFILGAALFSFMDVRRSLRASIDDFGFQLYSSPDFAVAEKDWNLLRVLIPQLVHLSSLFF